MRFGMLTLVVLCMVLSRAARSEIIHFRPDDPLFAGWGSTFPPNQPDDSLDVDFNFDGIFDINFKGQIQSGFYSFTYDNTLVLGVPPTYPNGGVYQVPLRYGDHISETPFLDWWPGTAVGWGTGSNGNLFNSYMAVGDQVLGIGAWGDDTVVGGSSEGYLGVRFEIDGKTHYGWVYIRAGSNTGWIDEWAYESTPGVGIVAGAVPEPSSLMLFVIGAWGTWLLRKEKNR